MKACVLHNINDLRYEEVEMPKVEKDEVLVKIMAAGICGSDIDRVFKKGTYHFPTIIGHEFAGVIVEVGEEVEESIIGKKVAVFPLLPCKECSPCQVGEYAQCKDYDYYGSRRDGGFAEYLAVKKWNLVFVPDEVTYEEAAMCEPCAVGIHALSQVGLEFRDTIAIYGAGTIGIMVAKIATAWGAKNVILVDIDDTKLSFAKKMGFENTINSMKQDPVEFINSLTDGNGADVVLEGTGAGVALENCLKSAKTFGKVILMGNPGGDVKVSQKAYWEILRKQLILRGTWNSGYNQIHNDWVKAIETMPLLNISEFISHRYDFSECNEAFEMMKDPNEFTVKVMFTVNE